MPRAFVSGGCGFIGSHIVERLIAEGYFVTVYDNLTSGRAEFLGHLPSEKFRLVVGDLLDLDRLRRAVAGHEIIFHLASNPDIAKSMQQTDLDLKQGIMATYNVLEAMRVNSVTRLVYPSGSGIYGDKGTELLTEKHGPLLPVSMYGASKLGCEAMISAFCQMFDMQTWIFRLANVVGDRMTHGVIFDFIRKLRSDGTHLDVNGNGTQSKSYVFIDDCLDAIFLAVGKSNERVNVFNVASDSHIKVSRIAEVVIEEMGLKNVEVRYQRDKKGWKGDVPVVRMDSSRIRSLGWPCKYNSEEAVRLATILMLAKERHQVKAIYADNRNS